MMFNGVFYNSGNKHSMIRVCAIYKVEDRVVMWLRLGLSIRLMVVEGRVEDGAEGWVEGRLDDRVEDMVEVWLRIGFDLFYLYNCIICFTLVSLLRDYYMFLINKY